MANDMMVGALAAELEAQHAVHAGTFDGRGKPAMPHELRRLRIAKRESQEKFWSRFGVTQSSGSRFETGLAIPGPVAILLRLYVNGKLSDGDLQA
ncbi:helix-turn-helix domain-containing protein [Massilia consociata]|uniref:Helix-turn-helix domain-containing protein n=1 Tax=Massilia consociata TaxID=760117 RepID=A0ABV6FAF4_9BURK